MQLLPNKKTDFDQIVLESNPVPGRIRLSVPALYRTDGLATRIRDGLIQHSGILKVQVNSLTGNVLVVYRFRKKTLVEIIQMLARVLKKESENRERQSSHRIMQWHCMAPDEVSRYLGSSSLSGVNPKAVQEQRKKFGNNFISRKAGRSKFSIFAQQYENLPAKLLIGSSVLSLLTNGIVDAVVVGVVLLVNGYLGYAMESTSEKIIQAIGSPDRRKIRVCRGDDHCTPHSKWLEIDPVDLVAGDIFLLEPGMTVPADGRLIWVESLTVDESALTGESFPASKQATTLHKSQLAIGDRINMVFRGTVVTGGSAMAIAVSVGNNSELGRIQGLMDLNMQPLTPLEKQLNRLGNQMSGTAVVVSGLVLGIGLLRGQRFIVVLKSALSLTVAAIPESLPTVATMTLARGLVNLKKQNVVVRHLRAIETLASIDHVCLDKTGTITMNQMEVTLIATFCGEFNLLESGVSLDDQSIDLNDYVAAKKLVEVCCLCNEAEVDRVRLDNEGRPIINGSATEKALLEMAYKTGSDPLELRIRYPLISTVYRSEMRHYMMTTHQTNTGKKLRAVKGSPLEVLELCKRYQKGNKSYPLSKSLKAAVTQKNEKFAKNGFRVLGVAYRIDEGPARDLIWLGLVSMNDPIRKDISKIIPIFNRAGIDFSMITGDQPVTAQAIGKTLGIQNIYARVSPARKLEIVREIQSSQNRVVAMIGDGVNDGPALKIADVGIAMAARENETASQAADIVLPSDNINGLISAIREGRSIHQDIKKAVDYAVSKNMSEILFTLVSTLIWKSEPLSPTQFLWINLITDTLPELALANESPANDVLKDGPEVYKQNILSKKDTGKVVFDSLALSIAPLLSYSFGMFQHGSTRRASSSAFLTMAGSSLLYTLNSRSNDVSILQYKNIPKNDHVNIAIGVGFAIQTLGIMFPPLRKLLALQEVTRLDLTSSALSSIWSLVAVELGKSIRKRSAA
ncbi:MAG: HAD-IC family P-type ATPase [Bdellovibrionia bacterium]